MNQIIAIALISATLCTNVQGQNWLYFPPGTNANYIKIHDLDVAGDQLTVEALVCLFDTTGTLGLNIVSKHIESDETNYLLRPCYPYGIQLTTDHGYKNLPNPRKLCLNTVYHLAATYDGDSLRYYVDGEMVASTPCTGNLILNNDTAVIGNRAYNPIEQFPGYIDEVRIWNVARTPGQLASNRYDLPSPALQAGLMAYYKFEENYTNLQGNALYDGVAVGVQLQNPINPYANLTASTNCLCNPTATTNLSITICQHDSFKLSTGQLITSSGIYQDTLKTAFDCDSVVTIAITVNPAYTQNISAFICPGDTFHLPSGNTASSAGTYFDTILTAYGCDSIFILDLSVHPQIEYSVVTQDATCHGKNDGVVYLTASDGTPPYSFQLDTAGNSNGVYDSLASGTYLWFMKDVYGCEVHGSCTVNQPLPVEITIDDSDQTIDRGDTAKFEFGCNYSFWTCTWNPMLGITYDTCTTVQATPDQNQLYNITLIVTANGVTCSADTNVLVRIRSRVFTPNTFTPNGDGINDVFQAFVSDIDNITTFTLQIYDRWGERVFDSLDKTEKWDGSFDGRALPSGVYVYFIRYRLFDATQYELIQGDVTLLR